jgi:hypothetical protein
MSKWLIDNAPSAWRMLSVQFAAVMGAWSALDPASQTAVLALLGIPADRQVAVLALVFLVLRLVKQPAVKPPEAP